ncbi:MAG: FAD:protein FMN transferase [Candidatus Abyssubacteria bacterium]
MGTVFTVKLQGPGDHPHAAKAALDEIRRIDRLLSTYKEDSEISEVNREAFRRPVGVGQHFRAVLAASRIYFDLSEGAFDPTVYPLMKLWGFTKKSGHLPSGEELRMATRLVGLEKVSFDEQRNSVRFSEDGMSLDFGGIAKGYAVDRAVQTLKEYGIRNAIIDAGGNFYALGTRADGTPWQAGIRHPLRLDEVIARLPVSEMGLATSGNYERFIEVEGKKYCHIIDPRTGEPVEGMLSATIVTDTAMAADALSTSVFVLGPEKGMELIERLPGVEGMLIYQENGSPENFKVLISSGLKDHIELLLVGAD